MIDNPEMGSYQRLLLASMERHDKGLAAIDLRLQQLALDLALLKQAAEKQLELENRVRKLEDRDLSGSAVGQYKKWIVGLSITVIASIVIPIVRVLLGA